ncbi:hypothetical protein EW026_g3303 [Hermanssonia centrifuga]|uniref:Uncharacterized protein n=1 Tax=Hermanssonia centrifuga TaxID=98765 RepID=A0A4S4KQ87_9APHY|nr:hypothetical protein EW026_g3303 [Hermanssonia centrifuga]
MHTQYVLLPSFRTLIEAIDTGSNKTALSSCNKLLKKQPQNDLVKALKALALSRLQKFEEAGALCEEILASKPTDESTLGAMSHTLRGLGRHMDIITMYESAWKQQPGNEELAIQTFSANARTGNWKLAQQVAIRLHKQFKEDRYLYWNVFCAVLQLEQASDPTTLPPLRPVLYKLAHRLITTSEVPSFYSPDRFYVHILILKELGLYEEAAALLESEKGKDICGRSLICDELRREIWVLKGSVKEEGQRAQDRILKKDDRNWLEFLSVLNATFHDINSTEEPTEETMAACQDQINKTQVFFAEIADRDGARDRSGPLALLELELRARKIALSIDPSALYTLTESYFQQYGDKPCCYEDLLPYVADFNVEDLSRWTSFLRMYTLSDTLDDLRRTTNALKLIRYSLTPAELTPESENARAAQYMDIYYNGLKHGKDLADTELQHADDLLALAAHAFVNSWKISGDQANLYNAITVLEFGLTRSKQAYQFRLMLIRIYHILGAPSLALEHYRLLNVKQVQTDTLSHFILTRASTFALSSLGDLTYSTECIEASQIYQSNSLDTAEFVIRAFLTEKYSQIADFVTLEDRLDNSLQRDLMKMEHVRMRVAHEPISAELVDVELVELKFIFDRLHYDNRDFDILPNYQPRSQPTFNEQTKMFGKIPGKGWLWMFLKVYILACRHASDMDDTAEEKLVLGDRPKTNPNIEAVKLPLQERLAMRPQEELDELTSDELALVNFETSVAEWLGPHHDFIRPLPSVEHTNGTKQIENPHTTNGTNGHSKKLDEQPTSKEPPEIATQFFDEMKQRFDTALQASSLPPELLHIVTLTQEAFLLFAIETTRFKSSAVVKAHKLGAVVQSIKDIRSKAAAVLTAMSVELDKLAAADGSPERSQVFIDACQPLVASEITEEFVSEVAKKVVDARKQIVEGIAKGVAKVCKNHA